MLDENNARHLRHGNVKEQLNPTVWFSVKLLQTLSRETEQRRPLVNCNSLNQQTLTTVRWTVENGTTCKSLWRLSCRGERFEKVTLRSTESIYFGRFGRFGNRHPHSLEVETVQDKSLRVIQ